MEVTILLSSAIGAPELCKYRRLTEGSQRLRRESKDLKQFSSDNFSLHSTLISTKCAPPTCPLLGLPGKEKPEKVDIRSLKKA